MSRYGWKLWKIVRQCKIMRRQMESHPADVLEYEIFAPEGYHFVGREHSLVEHDAQSALKACTNAISVCDCQEE